ncbi:MAG: FkbM family methyltransferase [Thermoleophilaceae bacterium]
MDRGEKDKHAVVAETRELNRALEDLAELLPRTNIAHVTVRPGEVLLESALAPVSFSVDLDDIGSPPLVSLALGAYEPDELAALSRLLDGASTFVDVGANVGWYSLHAAAAFPTLRVMALEPVPATIRSLERNVELNGGRVEVLPLGLAERPGEMELWIAPSQSGAASAAPSRHYPGQAPVLCRMTSLDALTAEHDLNVDVLKADLEGGELGALRGGLVTLERDRPAIMLELLRIHAAPFGYHPNDVIDLLAGLGYAAQVSGPSGLRPFAHMDEATTETNFFFLHRDRHAALMP